MPTKKILKGPQIRDGSSKWDGRWTIVSGNFIDWSICCSAVVSKERDSYCSAADTDTGALWASSPSLVSATPSNTRTSDADAAANPSVVAPEHMGPLKIQPISIRHSSTPSWWILTKTWLGLLVFREIYLPCFYWKLLFIKGASCSGDSCILGCRVRFPFEARLFFQYFFLRKLEGIADRSLRGPVSSDLMKSWRRLKV